MPDTGRDSPENDGENQAGLSRKDVSKDGEEVGCYGRAAVWIEVQGGDLGTLLIRHGLAWHYREFAPGETEYAHLH